MYPDPTRSTEVWAFNDSIPDEETLVAWARRGGPAGTNMSFNYGDNGVYGAVGHWNSPPDLGWQTTPAAGAWHHLVYTYDGTTTRVYADGTLDNSEELGSGVIATAGGFPIVVGARNESDGQLTLHYSGVIARVRVHSEVLSDEDVAANYELERAEFGL